MGSILEGFAPDNTPDSRRLAKEILSTPSSLQVIGGWLGQGIDYSSPVSLLDRFPEQADLIKLGAVALGAGGSTLGLIAPKLDEIVSPASLFTNSPLTKKEYETSDYYREPAPYYRGMTTRGAKNLAETYDRREAHKLLVSYTEGAPQYVLGFIAALLGGAIVDPITYATFGTAGVVSGLGKTAAIAKLTRAALLLEKASKARVLHPTTLLGKTITAGLTTSSYEVALSALWIKRDAMIGDDTTALDFMFQVGMAATLGGALGFASNFFGRSARPAKNASTEKRVALEAKAMDDIRNGKGVRIGAELGLQLDADEIVRSLVRDNTIDPAVLAKIKAVAKLSATEERLLQDRIIEVIANGSDDSVLDNLIELHLSISTDARQALNDHRFTQQGEKIDGEFLKHFMEGDESLNTLNAKQLEEVGARNKDNSVAMVKLEAKKDKLIKLSESVEDQLGDETLSTEKIGTLMEKSVKLKDEIEELEDAIARHAKAVIDGDTLEAELKQNIEARKHPFDVGVETRLEALDIISADYKNLPDDEAMKVYAEKLTEDADKNLKRMVNEGTFTEAELRALNREQDKLAEAYNDLAKNSEDFVNCVRGKITSA